MHSFFLLRAHLGNDLGLVHAVVDAVLDSRSRKPGSAQRVFAMIPLGSMRLATIIHGASLVISLHHGWPLWVWTGWLPGMSPLFKVGVLKKSPQSSCIFPNLLASWNPGHVQVQSKTHPGGWEALGVEPQVEGRGKGCSWVSKCPISNRLESEQYLSI